MSFHGGLQQQEDLRISQQQRPNNDQTSTKQRPPNDQTTSTQRPSNGTDILVFLNMRMGGWGMQLATSFAKCVRLVALGEWGIHKRGTGQSFAGARLQILLYRQHLVLWRHRSLSTRQGGLLHRYQRMLHSHPRLLHRHDNLLQRHYTHVP